MNNNTAENQEYSKRLIKAISTGNKLEALCLIAEGKPEQLFSPDKLDKTALQIAIIAKDKNIALALINKEGVTSAQLLRKEKFFDETAMDLAVAKDMKDVAEALSEKTGATIPKKEAPKIFSNLTSKIQPIQRRLDFRNERDKPCPASPR